MTTPTPTPGRFAELRRAVARFAEVYGWVAREQILRRRKRSLTIVLLSSLGPIAQGATIAAILSVFGMLGATERGQDGGLLASLADRPALALPLLGAVVLLLNVAGSWASFRAARLARTMAREFHVRVQQATFRALVDSETSGTPPLDETTFKSRASRNPILCGKAVESLLGLAEPIWLLVVAAVILVNVHPLLALLTIPLAVVIVPVAHRLSSGVERNTRQWFDVASRHVSIATSTLYNEIAHQNAREPSAIDQRLRELCEEHPDARAFLDEYDRLQLASNRVGFGIALASSFFLAYSIVGAGYLALVLDVPWTAVVAFLLALTQAMNALRAAFGQITNLAIYFSSVAASYDWIAAAPPSRPRAQTGGRVEAMTIDVNLDVRSVGRSERFTLERGRPCYLDAGEDFSRLSAARILRTLFGTASLAAKPTPADCCYFGQRALDPSGTIRSNFIPTTADAAAFQSACESIAGMSFREQLPLGVETPLDSAAWQHASEDLRAACLIAACALDPRPFLFLDIRTFRLTSQDFADRALARLRDRFVFLVVYGGATPVRAVDIVLICQNGVLGPALSVREYGEQRRSSSRERSSPPRSDGATELLEA